MPKKGLFDMHCHIVPQVDDGASSRQEALGMLEMEYEQGVRYIIATPHYRIGMFETPIEEVRQQFLVLRKLAAQVSPNLKLYLGREFHFNMEMVKTLDEHPALRMIGSRYVLAEFSRPTPYAKIKERTNSLRAHGYIPIIAHIERYECLVKDMDLVEELMEMGARMQVNADSVTGHSGFGMKRYCKKLLDNGMISYIASDCHGTKHRISRIGEAYDFVSKKYGEEYADTIFITNPRKIIRDAVKQSELRRG